MNVNFGLFPPIEGRTKKADRKKLYTDRAKARSATRGRPRAVAESAVWQAQRLRLAARRCGAAFGAARCVGDIRPRSSAPVAIARRRSPNFVAGPHRPFLEGQPAVMVGVEPGKARRRGWSSSSSVIRPSLSRSARSKRRCSRVRSSADGGRRRRRRAARRRPRSAGGAAGTGSSSSSAQPGQMKKPAAISSNADPPRRGIAACRPPCLAANASRSDRSNVQSADQRAGQAMAEHAQHPRRRALPFPARGAALDVAPGQHRQHAERPQRARPAPPSSRAAAASSAARRVLGIARCAGRDRPAPSARPPRSTATPALAEQPGDEAEQQAAARRGIGIEIAALERRVGEQRSSPPPSRPARRRDPAEATCAASACSTGSGGGGARSSRSSASRHQARRIAADHRLAAGGEDRAQSDVKTPERLDAPARRARRAT